MGSALSYLLDEVESQQTSAPQKCQAFDALDEIVEEAYTNHWGDYYDKDELHERIMIVCLDEVKHRITTNDSSSISNMKLGRLMRNSTFNNVVDRMIEDEFFFPWLLEGICKGANDDHIEFSSVLANFVWASSKEQIVTTIVRHFHGIQEAFKCIFSRSAVSVSTINEFLSGSNYGGIEYAGIMATMPSALCEWAEKTAEKDKTEVCDILIQVLRISFDSPVTLRNLLGCDLLSISAYLSHLPIGSLYYSSQADKHAAVFGRILRIYPQFNQQFRNWTNDGVRGNPIAAIGQSIPPKDPNGKGTDYVFYEEDSEE